MARRATTAAPVANETVSAAGHSYVEWGAVACGAAVSLAISTVLFQFGTNVGLSTGVDLESVGKNPALMLVAVGVWLLWVPLVSAMAGGYLAGMMRGRWPGATAEQTEMRDGIQGLTVWAVSTLAAAAGAALLAAVTAALAKAGAQGGQAAEVSEMARNSGVILGFIAAAAAFLSAGIAWWAATVGGKHRDDGIDANEFVPSFLRR